MGEKSSSQVGYDATMEQEYVKREEDGLEVAYLDTGGDPDLWEEQLPIWTSQVPAERKAETERQRESLYYDPLLYFSTVFFCFGSLCIALSVLCRPMLSSWYLIRATALLLRGSSHSHAPQRGKSGVGVACSSPTTRCSAKAVAPRW